MCGLNCDWEIWHHEYDLHNIPVYFLCKNSGKMGKRGCYSNSR